MHLLLQLELTVDHLFGVLGFKEEALEDVDHLDLVNQRGAYLLEEVEG